MNTTSISRSISLYTVIGWLGMVAVPIAPAFFFAWRIYSEAITLTQRPWLAIPVAIFSAIGLEIVGIYAGHVGMQYHQRADRRWWLAAGIMLIYVAIGVYELRGTIGMVMFLITPLVYILVALHHGLSEQQAEETAVSQFELAERRRQAEWEREQKAADREARRQLKLQKARPDTRQHTGMMPQTNGKMPADWRQLDRQQKHHLAHLTREERENAMPDLAARTRRAWHNRLDKIAAQNGHYQKESS